MHISQDIRAGIIYYWLKGSSRDEIASKFIVSSGAVSKIVNEWRNSIGSYNADDLRELSLSIKKAQISPIECAIGFRIAKLMQRFGIKEDEFERFMIEIYNKCQLLELGPNQIIEYLTETIYLLNTVFPSQIPTYIDTKMNEIENLNEQIENKQNSIKDLNNKKFKEEEELKSLLETNNVSKEAIKWYKDIIKEIIDNGIPIDNVGFFIECLKGIKNEGYDVNEVLMEYSDSVSLSKSIEIKNSIKQTIIQDIDNLKNHKNFLEEKISSDLLKLSKLQELEYLGFGLKELKTLYNTITEITKENNINSKEAIQDFFDQLNDYDKYIDLKKVENLKNELANINRQIATNRTILQVQPGIETTLQALLRIGISEKDIVEINSILFFGGFDINNNDNGGSAVINKESLIFELNKYHNIKLVLKSLEQKQTDLTSHITNLEHQKILAENYIHFLFSNLKEIQILLKKASIALEHPKIILVNVSFDHFKDDDKK